MYDSKFVHVVEGFENLFYNLGSIHLAQGFLPLDYSIDMVHQVPILHKLHDTVEILLITKQLQDVDHMRMIEHLEHSKLVLYMLTVIPRPTDFLFV